MLYRVVMSQTERSTWEALVGGSLDRVSRDGWAVHLSFGGEYLRIIPKEETVSDELHPYAGVTRPLLELLEPAEKQWKEVELLGENLGTVEEVWVLTTVVTFTFPETLPETEPVAGLKIPGGVRYGPIFHHPDQLENLEKKAPDHSVVQLDIGVEIRTGKHDVVIYTDSGAYLARAVVDQKKPPGLPRKEKLGRSWALPGSR